MGHPAAAVAWLVNALAPGDRHLKPGALVLPDGLTASVPDAAGGGLSAELDGLGAIEVYG
jgi:2-oxo-3-hexenedioate decarboxylase